MPFFSINKLSIEEIEYKYFFFTQKDDYSGRHVEPKTSPQVYQKHLSRNPNPLSTPLNTPCRSPRPSSRTEPNRRSKPEPPVPK